MQLKIEYLKPSEIKEYASNPRSHNETQITQIAKSIDQFGFNNPLLIDENSILIAGHGRLAAVKLLKLKQVPVVRLSHLNEAEKRAYRIADNKLTENGRWDEDLLKIEFSEIEKMSLELKTDFSLDITGFSLPDIDFLMQEKTKAEKADEKLNAVPYVLENEIISKHGDIWLLGHHKIICGDSLKAETFQNLLKKQKADLIISDPPFNVKIQGHVCGNGKTKHKEFAFASGEMNESEFIEFLRQAMQNMSDFSKDNAVHFLFMDWRHLYEMISASRSVYPKMLNLIVWCKQNGGMGSFYRSQHELIFAFQKGKGSHTNNVELGKHGRYRTNVWHYAGVNSFGPNQKNLCMHPTVKPVELLQDAILDASKRGEIVLDAFLGSGSTLIAAEKSGRLCFGVEYEPLYIDTIIRRYHELTGIWAIHEQSGESYNNLLEKRKEHKNDGI